MYTNELLLFAILTCLNRAKKSNTKLSKAKAVTNFDRPRFNGLVPDFAYKSGLFKETMMGSQ